MNKFIIMAAAAVSSLAAVAEDISVERFEYTGPVVLPTRVQIGEPWPEKDAKALDISLLPGRNGSVEAVSVLPTAEGDAFHMLSFDVENRQFAAIELEVEGLDEYVVFIDDVRHSGGSAKLRPGTHRIDIKCMAKVGKEAKPVVKVKTEKDGIVKVGGDGKRMFTLSDVMFGTRINGASMSPSGRYMLASYSDTRKDGSVTRYQRVYDTRTGKQAGAPAQDARWMPRSDKYYQTRNDYEHGRHIVVTDPSTGQEEIIASKIPDGNFTIMPSEQSLLYSMVRQGRKADADAYLVLEPDDRQPGWRNRSYPALYDINGSGALVPLTQGRDNCVVADISADGRYLLLMSSHTRLQQRPTTVNSLAILDLQTMKADTIVEEEGFLVSASLSPDAKHVLAVASPEAFGRVGCVLPDTVTPSMSQQELFIIDTSGRKVMPITRDFGPSIQNAVWSRHDGRIYARVEERDIYSVYAYNPAKGVWSLVPMPESIVKGISLAESSPLMAVWAQSESNPDRLYAIDSRNGKSALLDSPSESRLSDVKLGVCEDWNFANSRGDTIYGRFYLPDNFDPAKKYPLIVNYYGGCSPTQRQFDGRYPWHAYAALGYVVYVVQPSGATGFGQEFSSRHVSTAGRGVAEDIIEGTKQFVAAHPYVDGSKIGCIGASYGGFMTMYLQTVTDIFAAAVSHAGISDHTSYWGEGYWGYNYSEVSMGDNKPWSNPDLYVKQSPLYNADKVQTPILFVHGDADTNVPVGESIQMFTALKLLGRETALVQIAGQNHHILDTAKRQKWQEAIWAWFAKHLQGDSAWWDELYPDY